MKALHFSKAAGRLFALLLLCVAACSVEADVATPELRPLYGAFYTRTAVEITCATPGATIHYTLDGTEPGLGSPTIPTGNTVVVGRALTLKARAVLDLRK